MRVGNVPYVDTLAIEVCREEAAAATECEAARTAVDQPRRLGELTEQPRMPWIGHVPELVILMDVLYSYSGGEAYGEDPPVRAEREVLGAQPRDPV